MVYLVVQDPAEKGVYSFQSRSIAEDIAHNFKNYVFMHEDEQEQALKLVGTSEVIDALFLIRKYRASKPRTKTREQPKPQPQEKIQTPKIATSENKFSKIFQKLEAAGIDTFKISMSSGETYVISMKNTFFTTTPGIHEHFLVSSNGNVGINTVVVDDCISNKRIGVLGQTKIEYIENFAVISGCDDEYSPDVFETPDGLTSYKHRFDKIVLNMDRVETITPTTTPDLGAYIIRNSLLKNYLTKNML